MISFNNTEIAFKHKTNADLRRANFLFSVMASPGFVKAGKGVTSFFLNIGLPIQGMIKATIFKQFCGGETIEECTPTINSMGKIMSVPFWIIRLKEKNRRKILKQRLTKSLPPLPKQKITKAFRLPFLKSQELPNLRSLKKQMHPNRTSVKQKKRLIIW